MYNPSYATCGKASCKGDNDGVGTRAWQEGATASTHALSAYAAPIGGRKGAKGGRL